MRCAVKQKTCAIRNYGAETGNSQPSGNKEECRKTRLLYGVGIIGEHVRSARRIVSQNQSLVSETEMVL